MTLAQAKQIAASRGYDPNLVDADNYDRVDTAFPVQSTPSKPAPTSGVATSASVSYAPGSTGPGTATGATPSAAISAVMPTPASSAPSLSASGPAATAPASTTAEPMGSPTGGAPTSGGGAAPGAAATDPNAQQAMMGIQSVASGGGSMGNSGNNFSAPGDPYGLRPGLSTRMFPLESSALAGLRKAY